MNQNIETINVITPFKNYTNKHINKTISSLIKLSSLIKVNHIVIYDLIASRNIREIISKIDNKKYPNFFFKAISTKQKGIYSAINIGLNSISFESYYIVLGEGDLIKNKNKYLDIKKSKIILIDYELSQSHITNKFRNFYSGMPYCHNAIIFKNNGLKYNSNYKISSDYDYLIKYLKKESINFKKIKDYFLNDFIYTIFESKEGISSKSKFTKYYENFQISFKNFGIYGLFYFFIFFIKKISKLGD